MTDLPPKAKGPARSIGEGLRGAMGDPNTTDFLINGAPGLIGNARNNIADYRAEVMNGQTLGDFSFPKKIGHGTMLGVMGVGSVVNDFCAMCEGDTGALSPTSGGAFPTGPKTPTR